MNRSRRTFLAGAGAAVSSGLLTPTAKGAPTPPTAAHPPRGLTLATIRTGGTTTLAVKTARGLLDVARAAAALRQHAPTTMEEVLRGNGGAELRALVDKAVQASPKELYVDEGRAEFGPCVPAPEKIVCVGLNYRKHAAETGNPVPTRPILFNKYNSALNAHRGVIAVSREAATEFDYEVELVVVMGRTARDVAESDALSYVFGYCTGNDFTARDLQRASSQWMLGKTLDGSAPVGPYLVSADQVPDPGRLKIECRVNGELRQSSTTADMVFGCASLVSYISRYFTLKPGDLIFTGTPEGVIAGYPKDKQVWLKAGDRVTSTVEGLGELEFRLT